MKVLGSDLTGTDSISWRDSTGCFGESSHSRCESQFGPAARCRGNAFDFKPDSPEDPPKEFRFPVEKFKSEMGKAGYKLAAQHDFLPRQRFLIFEVAGAPSR